MKILIVDDHQLIREGLRPVMQQLTPPGDPVEVLEATSFEAASALTDAHPDIDLVLLDLRLRDNTGLAALSGLQARHPGLPIMVVSGEDDPGLVRAAFDHGALGYIPKSSTTQVILNAIRVVLSGGTYLPREIMFNATNPFDPAGTMAPAHALRGLDITPRQAEVLTLLLAGKSDKEICRELGLAEGTVKSHIAAAFKALNVTTRAQAVIAAAKLGIKA